MPEIQIPPTMQDKWGSLKPTKDFSKWNDQNVNEEIRKQITAAPRDPRFPQQNKTKWCWTYFVDYHRCLTLKGEDYKPCKFFKDVYMDVCPRYWVNNWEEWVSEGRFPAAFDR